MAGASKSGQTLLPIEKKPDGIVLNIYVQPKASKNEVSGVHNNAMKIRITAPPSDNKANQMCLKFLAKQLNLPKSNLELISGQTSRNKQIFIPYTTPEKKNQQEKQLIEKLSQLL